MQRVAGHLNFAEIGNLTGVHPETVRRYMTHGRPTAFFVAAIAKALATPLEWLLHGLVGGVASEDVPQNGVAKQRLPDRVQNQPGAVNGGILEVQTPRRRATTGGGRTVKPARSR